MPSKSVSQVISGATGPQGQQHRHVLDSFFFFFFFFFEVAAKKCYAAEEEEEERAAACWCDSIQQHAQPVGTGDGAKKLSFLVKTDCFCFVFLGKKHKAVKVGGRVGGWVGGSASSLCWRAIVRILRLHT